MVNNGILTTVIINRVMIGLITSFRLKSSKKKVHEPSKSNSDEEEIIEKVETPIPPPPVSNTVSAPPAVHRIEMSMLDRFLTQILVRILELQHLEPLDLMVILVA